jgi:hypothetical protein
MFRFRSRIEVFVWSQCAMSSSGWQSSRIPRMKHHVKFVSSESLAKHYCSTSKTPGTAIKQHFTRGSKVPNKSQKTDLMNSILILMSRHGTGSYVYVFGNRKCRRRDPPSYSQKYMYMKEVYMKKSAPADQTVLPLPRQHPHSVHDDKTTNSVLYRQ